MASFSGFNIDAFRARFVNSYKTYLFYFTPSWPGGISSDITQDNATYLVRASNLPGRNVTVNTIEWQGVPYKYGGKTEGAQSWTVEFLLDNNLSLYNTYIEYLRLIHDPDTNIHGDPSEYQLQQTLYLLDHKNRGPVLKCNFIDMFPTTVPAIDLAYSDDGSPKTFSVTFEYTRHTYETFRY